MPPGVLTGAAGAHSDGCLAHMRVPHWDMDSSYSQGLRSCRHRAPSWGWLSGPLCASEPNSEPKSGCNLLGEHQTTCTQSAPILDVRSDGSLSPVAGGETAQPLGAKGVVYLCGSQSLLGESGIWNACLKSLSKRLSSGEVRTAWGPHPLAHARENVRDFQP